MELGQSASGGVEHQQHDAVVWAYVSQIEVRAIDALVGLLVGGHADQPGQCRLNFTLLDPAKNLNAEVQTEEKLVESFRSFHLKRIAIFNPIACAGSHAK